MHPTYSVLWRIDNGPIHAGKVTLGGPELALEGTVHAHHPWSTSIPLESLAGIRHTCAGDEAIYGRDTLVLELRRDHSVEIASANGADTLLDLEERLAALAPGIPVD